MTGSGTVRSRFGAALAALALAGVLAGFAAPARADDDWRGRERAEHERFRRERERREWRAHHRPVYVAPPEQVYAPPVELAPPPAPGINLIFPIHIR